MPQAAERTEERAKELNDMIRSAQAYTAKFNVAVSFETPYAKYFFEPGRAYWFHMK